MRDGTIVEQGTHQELMANDSEYASLIQMLSKDENLRSDIVESMHFYYIFFFLLYTETCFSFLLKSSEQLAIRS